jgi:hypothetical protein
MCRIGDTRLRLHVLPAIRAGSGSPRFAASAVHADTHEPVTEHGARLERVRADPEQALEALRCRLEEVFGPRRRLSPRRT